MDDRFRRLAHRTAEAVGSPWAFMAGVAVIVLWAVSGPLFGYSDTWQLVINTGTTVVTFLVVFLIQNTQNRDAKAIQNLEDFSDEELEHLHQEFERLRERLVRHKAHGSPHPESGHPGGGRSGDATGRGPAR